MPDLELDERSREILDMERLPPSGQGARESEAWRRWQLTPTRYFQVLSALIDTEAALAYDPLTVNRLRRTRERFSKVRSRRPRPAETR